MSRMATGMQIFRKQEIVLRIFVLPKVFHFVLISDGWLRI